MKENMAGVVLYKRWAEAINPLWSEASLEDEVDQAVYM